MTTTLIPRADQQDSPGEPDEPWVSAEEEDTPGEPDEPWEPEPEPETEDEG